MSRPTVASYCTTFLKPEMLHIYRQVTGLQRYQTFVVAKERICEEQFPFEDVEMVPKKPRKNFIRRFYLKHIRKLPPIYYRGEMQGLTKIFRRRHSDLMHIYFGHTGVHLLPFVESWDKPCIVSFHGADVMLRPHQPEYEKQLKRLLEILPLVLARSHSLRDRLVNLGCPESKIRINRTGIPLDQFAFKPRMMPADGEWRFVQACRLIAKKGINTSLKAFAEFHKRFPKSSFTIAGEGPLKEEIEKEIHGLGLQKAVTLAGFLGQKELCSLYYNSHVFMHPSRKTSDQNQEGVPNSMLEAMSTGLPVLATLHGGIPEAVIDGGTGFLVPERDDAALLKAMLAITESEDLLYTMGQSASRSVGSEFEQSKAIAKLESFYDEALHIGPLSKATKATPAESPSPATR
jgi:colanic acid/amylovoran biosynthesis glycosyltransferase